MGHSTSAIGYRLSHHRNWKFSLGLPKTDPSLGDAHISSILDAYFQRFFLADSRHNPLFLYSHCVAHRPGPPAPPQIHLFLHSPHYQRLLRFLSRRGRFHPFNPFSVEFCAFPLLPPRPRVFSSSLTSLYPPFLKFSILHLLSNIFTAVLRPLPLWGSRPPLVRLFFLDSVPTAPLLCRFLLLKLRSGRHRLSRLIGTYLFHNFSAYSKRGIVGFLVQGAGRFTRSQMASRISSMRGRLPLSSMGVHVDYLASSVVLKYGVCSLKIWIAYAP